MAVSTTDRFTIGNTQPKFNANRFNGLSSNAPIGGNDLQNMSLSADDLLGSIAKALGISANFKLSKSDLLDTLLQALGIDLSSQLGNLLNKLVNLLDLSLLKMLENRILRMLDLISPDSELCKLLQTLDDLKDKKFGDLDIILSGFISLSYDLCDSDILDKMLGNINDDKVKTSILIKLLIDVSTSGNSRLLIAIINNPNASNIGTYLPNIGEIIGTNYTSVNIDNYNNNTVSLSNNSRNILTGGIRPVTIDYNGNTITILPGWNDNYLLLNGIKNVFPNLTNNNYSTIWFGNITDDFISGILRSIIELNIDDITNQAYTIGENPIALLYVILLNYSEINMNYINNIISEGKGNIDQQLLGLINPNRPLSFCAPKISSIIDTSYQIDDDIIDIRA